MNALKAILSLSRGYCNDYPERRSYTCSPKGNFLKVVYDNLGVIELSSMVWDTCPHCSGTAPLRHGTGVPNRGNMQ